MESTKWHVSIFNQLVTLGARGILREAPRSSDKESSAERRERERGEKTSGCSRQLIDLTRANRFELGSRSDPAS